MELINQEVKETEYTIKLNQSELNTIAAALRECADNNVKEFAKDFRTKKYYTGRTLVGLYDSFCDLTV